MKKVIAGLLAGVLWIGCAKTPAPYMEDGRVVFTYRNAEAETVALAGPFNGWSDGATPMTRNDRGVWTARVGLSVGYHEYRFVVDGEWTHDPANPATVTNNYGEPNSVLYVTPTGEIELKVPQTGADGLVKMPGGEGFIYLALIWHQHQPNYYNAANDQLIAPWVRTHTTKDYYDMTAMLKKHPNIHVTVNLTPVLVEQINLYTQRLGEFYDSKTKRLDADKFLAKFKGRTDPWIDLMLTDTENFGPEEDQYLVRNEWSCFSVSRVIINRFPEYAALREKSPEEFTVQDKRNLKCFFWLALFDPDFLRGPVKLSETVTVDLSDLITEGPDETWTLKRPFTEADALRLVSDFYLIAYRLRFLHRDMRYDADSHTGQIEMITTPYAHPILPLIYDVHAGKSPNDQAPDSVRFARPHDARWHVKQANLAYFDWYNTFPQGMWPAEGSVSQDVIKLFTGENLDWIATGDGVLAKSTPEGLRATTPYRVSDGIGGELAVFFRDTHLSDLIGFRYQRWSPEQASEDLIRQILSHAPDAAEDTVVITILLDGENAWEWYEQDADAKQFLHQFYAKLSEKQAVGRLKTVTPSEYIEGNPKRGIAPHPVNQLPVIDELWPGSWIYADFSTWVGENEENRAWWWLNKVRQDYERATAGLSKTEYRARKDALDAAWAAMAAAEGSDWFWWYGTDQNTGEGDTRWDQLFRAHLETVYRELQRGGFEVEMPDIPPLMDAGSDGAGKGGAMARGELSAD